MTDAELAAWGAAEYEKRVADLKTVQERSAARAKAVGMTLEEAWQAIIRGHPQFQKYLPKEDSK